MISKNDMMLVNDIIYKIHTIDDFDKMRISVLSALKFLIPYEAATYYLAPPDSDYHLTQPVAIGLSKERLNKYLDEYEAMDYTRWTYASPSAMVFRETDLISEDVRVATPYYQNAFAPIGFHYSAMLTIVYEGKFYGCMNLFRTKEQHDFSDDEMTFLDLLKTHICYRTYKNSAAVMRKQPHYPSSDLLVDKYKFTLREIEIIHLLIDGMSREDICEKLSISVNTLKKHTSNIYKKANVSSWRELYNIIENDD